VAAPEVIDAALRDGGGFPMGPLALTDLIGQDVNFAVTCSVFNAFWQDRRCHRSSSRSWRWPGGWVKRAATASIAGPLRRCRTRRCRRSPLARNPLRRK
jgi:3-hydroxyacyl-CoA dehydrogenase